MAESHALQRTVLCTRKVSIGGTCLYSFLSWPPSQESSHRNPRLQTLSIVYVWLHSLLRVVKRERNKQAGGVRNYGAGRWPGLVQERFSEPSADLPDRAWHLVRERCELSMSRLELSSLIGSVQTNRKAEQAVQFPCALHTLPVHVSG